MNIRKIKIYSTVGVSGTIETNVTTLAELKPLLSQREIDYKGMKMLVGETRNELSQDEALLPEGDFKLYLMPVKTKSGGTEEIANLFDRLSNIYADLAEEFANLDLAPAAKNYGTKSSQSEEDAEAMRDLERLNRG